MGGLGYGQYIRWGGGGGGYGANGAAATFMVELVTVVPLVVDTPRRLDGGAPVGHGEELLVGEERIGCGGNTFAPG